MQKRNILTFMDLNNIVKKALTEIGGEQHAALVPALVKKIKPTLEAKARKLVSPRLLQKVFAESLRKKAVPTETNSNTPP